MLRGNRVAYAVLALVAALVLASSTQLGSARAVEGPPVPVLARVVAAADSHVVREQPTRTFGAREKLTASNWPAWHTIAYLRFVVPDMPGTRPASSAKLELTLTFRQPERVELRPVTAGWDEQTLTYANRPGLGQPVATAGGDDASPTMTFDLTGYVTGPGTYSFAIVNPTENSALAARSSEHSDSAQRPTLVLSGEGGTTPPTGTLCGASFDTEGETYTDALDREDQLYNGLELVRVFHRELPAWRGSWADWAARPVNVSFKYNAVEVSNGKHDAELRSWFAGVPHDRDVYWTYYHEPEDNIGNGEFSAADYRAAWKRLKTLADDAGNPRLHATLVLMQWTLSEESGRDWRDYYAGPATIDVLAWDVYNYETQVKQGTYRTPQEMFDQIIQISEQEGRPWAVAEFGSHLAAGDRGIVRAAWLRESVAYATKHRALYVAYFDLDWPSGDYRLRDTAGQAAWREFCS